MTVLTFIFITYPFFKKRSGLSAAGAVADDKLQELHSRRDTAYSMLKELEFDFQSGILTDEDYKDLEARYKGKAISILREIDSLAKDDDIEDIIEKQVMALRRSKERFCRQCGAGRRQDDRFCSHCGANLRLDVRD
jgi:hypothetical protein